MPSAAHSVGRMGVGEALDRPGFCEHFFYLDESGKFERVFVWFGGENVLV